MAIRTLQSLLLTGLCLVTSTTAQIDSQLVGTWSTKSAQVFTGPGFYNPVNDSFIEPSLTGISFSFTADGFYEEAFFRAISVPTNPACPQAILQFQHGTVVMNSDLSLTLTPFAVDGRQLLSDPCESVATYTRYNQTEKYEKWQVYIDPYTKLNRLDLYSSGGAPMNPMFLAYNPPQMLPTVTMNPTATATAAATAKAKAKRGVEDLLTFPLNKDAKHIKRDGVVVPESLIQRIDLNMLWWTGVGMTVLGGVAYML